MLSETDVTSNPGRPDAIAGRRGAGPPGRRGAGAPGRRAAGAPGRRAAGAPGRRGVLPPDGSAGCPKGSPTRSRVTRQPP